MWNSSMTGSFLCSKIISNSRYFKVKDLIVKKKEAKFRASKNKDGDLILEKIE